MEYKETKGGLQTKFVSVMILVLAGLIALSSFGKEPSVVYHGGALYGCQGPVKEIKIKSKDPFLYNKKIKFLRDGRIDNSLMTYNSGGYPIGFDVTGYGREINVSVSYDSLCQVSEIRMVNNIIGNKSDLVVKYTYDSGRMVKRIVDDISRHITITDKYSAQTYDEFGNWVSRKVETLRSEAGMEAPSTIYEESRTITYYH